MHRLSLLILAVGMAGCAPKPVPLPMQSHVPTIAATLLPPTPQHLLDMAQAAPVTWTRTWNSAVMERNYPRDALSKGIEADVLVICDWNNSGAITDCSVYQETPEGHGFGAATVTMLRQAARVGPKDPTVALRAGRGLPTIVRWKIG